MLNKNKVCKKEATPIKTSRLPRYKLASKLKKQLFNKQFKPKTTTANENHVSKGFPSNQK